MPSTGLPTSLAATAVVPEAEAAMAMTILLEETAKAITATVIIVAAGIIARAVETRDILGTTLIPAKESLVATIPTTEILVKAIEKTATEAAANNRITAVAAAAAKITTTAVVAA
jgi:hypothetical protein